jgi:hypothetical protein
LRAAGAGISRTPEDTSSRARKDTKPRTGQQADAGFSFLSLFIGQTGLRPFGGFARQDSFVLRVWRLF